MILTVVYLYASGEPMSEKSDLAELFFVLSMNRLVMYVKVHEEY